MFTWGSNNDAVGFPKQPWLLKSVSTPSTASDITSSEVGERDERRIGWNWNGVEKITSDHRPPHYDRCSLSINDNTMLGLNHFHFSTSFLDFVKTGKFDKKEKKTKMSDEAEFNVCIWSVCNLVASSKGMAMLSLFKASGRHLPSKELMDSSTPICIEWVDLLG